MSYLDTDRIKNQNNRSVHYYIMNWILEVYLLCQSKNIKIHKMQSIKINPSLHML